MKEIFKKLYYLALFCLFYSIFAISCVDLYNPKLISEKERFVVECRITTELDFQWIFLSYDAGYNSSETNFTNLVRGASIWITDDAGNRFDFYDETNLKANIRTGLGFDYRSTRKFQAVVGRTYQLFIRTQNGKNYSSKPEKVRVAPKIEKVYWEFKPLPAFAFNPRGEFLIYTDLKDSPTTGDYYQWEAVHYKQIEFCRYWDTRTNLFKDPCCSDCWESEICHECKQFASDKLINGKEIRKKYIGKAPYTTTTPYYLMVKVYSISEETFNFWNAIQAQTKNSGGLFDATPKSVRGNMFNVNDSEEEVLGIFSACDVADKVVYIDRNITGYKPFDPQPETYTATTNCFPCIEAQTRSNFPPKEWIRLK